MKIRIKKIGLWLLAVAATVLPISCTTDEFTDENNVNVNKQGTLFVGGAYKGKSREKTRGYMHFRLSKPQDAKFFWFKYTDKIFLEDGSSATPLDNDYYLDVANFRFPGKAFTEQSYKVYFPNRSDATATDFKKFTIPYYQGNLNWTEINENLTPLVPDCGFAKAERQPDGSYYFEIEHQPAYIALYPRVMSKELGRYLSLDTIKITADENISGDFTITPSGLTGTGNSKSVTRISPGPFTNVYNK